MSRSASRRAAFQNESPASPDEVIDTYARAGAKNAKNGNPLTALQIK
jgi:hypothetical protein